MILVDAGPLVAIIDSRDAWHARCAAAAARVTWPLITTWPVITEAMHLLGSRSGWFAQEKLWRPFLRGDIRLDELLVRDHQVMAELMARYKQVGMDIADASLIVLADRLNTQTIFTTDSDFLIYRTVKNRPFRVYPQAMQEP